MDNTKKKFGKNEKEKIEENWRKTKRIFEEKEMKKKSFLPTKSNSKCKILNEHVRISCNFTENKLINHYEETFSHLYS